MVACLKSREATLFLSVRSGGVPDVRWRSTDWSAVGVLIRVTPCSVDQVDIRRREFLSHLASEHSFAFLHEDLQRRYGWRPLCTSQSGRSYGIPASGYSSMSVMLRSSWTGHAPPLSLVVGL